MCLAPCHPSATLCDTRYHLRGRWMSKLNLLPFRTQLTRISELVMAGAAKKNAQREKKQQQNSSNSSSSESRDPTQQSSPKSIPRLDGNRDPNISTSTAIEHSKANDLKNISEFLGIAGWYTARGVSINVLLSPFTHIGRYPSIPTPAWHLSIAFHARIFPCSLLCCMRHSNMKSNNTVRSRSPMFCPSVPRHSTRMAGNAASR